MTNARSFDILAINLSVLRNYFDDSNKIIFKFVNKFLDISEQIGFFMYEIEWSIFRFFFRSIWFRIKIEIENGLSVIAISSSICRI